MNTRRVSHTNHESDPVYVTHEDETCVTYEFETCVTYKSHMKLIYPVCEACVTFESHMKLTYGVATISRLLKIIGLFCKTAL